MSDYDTIFPPQRAEREKKSGVACTSVDRKIPNLCKKSHHHHHFGGGMGSRTWCSLLLTHELIVIYGQTLYHVEEERNTRMLGYVCMCVQEVTFALHTHVLTNVT